MLVGLVALLVAGCGGDGDEPGAGAPATTPALEGGEPAPDFEVTLFDGEVFSLSEHLATDGRPVVLNFWASWCLPCRDEMPEFDEIASAHPEVVFVGVAVDDAADSARRFALEEIQVGYSVGADTDGTVSAAYDHIGLPWTWLISADGNVVFEFRGRAVAAQLESAVEQLAG